MGANDNYPMGVNGSHDHFNQPDPPATPFCSNEECLEPIEHHYWDYCPICGQEIHWSKWDPERGEWR